MEVLPVELARELLAPDESEPFLEVAVHGEDDGRKKREDDSLRDDRFERC
jgi:hypothetical protein